MSKKKIALIEDDEIILGIYEMILKDAGFEVKVGRNGEEGLVLLKKYTPDLVLLDIMMPKMNGATMLKKLRRESWGKDLKVVILTNVGKSETPEDLDKLSVEEIVIKVNMSPDQLIELVKSLA